jgi:hypothetical protein
MLLAAAARAAGFLFVKDVQLLIKWSFIQTNSRVGRPA